MDKKECPAKAKNKPEVAGLMTDERKVKWSMTKNKLTKTVGSKPKNNMKLQMEKMTMEKILAETVGLVPDLDTSCRNHWLNATMH